MTRRGQGRGRQCAAAESWLGPPSVHFCVPGVGTLTNEITCTHPSPSVIPSSFTKAGGEKQALDELYDMTPLLLNIRTHTRAHIKKEHPEECVYSHDLWVVALGVMIFVVVCLYFSLPAMNKDCSCFFRGREICITLLHM